MKRVSFAAQTYPLPVQTSSSGGGSGPTGYPPLPVTNGNFVLNNSSGIYSWQPVGGYQILSFTLSGTGVQPIVEVGTSLAGVNYAATFNFSPSSITVAWSGIASGSISGAPASGSLTGGPFTSSTNAAQLTVSITAIDPTGAPHVATKTIIWAAKIVYGSIAQGTEVPGQALWNALNGMGSQLQYTLTGNYAFTSPINQDQVFGIISALGAPVLTSGLFSYPPTLIGSSNVTENGTTQNVSFYTAANPGSTITFAMSP